MRDLWRISLWGLAATGSLSIVAYAGSTEIGRDRAGIAVAELHEVLLPSGVKPARALSAQEGRRLAETVRLLSADRERLVARIASLEHSLDEVTGSIAKTQKAADDTQTKPAETPPAEVAAPATQQSNPPQEDVTSSITPAEAPQGEPEQAPAKTQYGLDLGTASSIDQLRAAWTLAQRRHSSLLQGLTPAVHQRPRSGRAEFHLLAGPLPSAVAAAKICASMTAAGGICRPAVFDGQRLAVR